MVGAIVHQLTRNLSEEQIKTAGFDTYFVDHTAGIYPQFASGTPWTASTMQVKGDLIADLTEDLAAEQKARVTYDNILRLSDDPDVNDVIKFLRAREIVHFQRFGERIREERQKLNLTQAKLAEAVDISDTYMGAIERGERSLTLDTLVRLANRLGVTVDYLLSDSVSNNDANILEQFKQGIHSLW